MDECVVERGIPKASGMGEVDATLSSIPDKPFRQHVSDKPRDLLDWPDQIFDFPHDLRSERRYIPGHRLLVTRDRDNHTGEEDQNTKMVSFQ